ncbi:hypothetical protein GCM10020000_69830 [Streptomyces olivoverticillatus]
MMVPLALLVLGGLVAAMAPRVLTRTDWPDREPVLALWVWQCVVAAVLLCCALAMLLSAAAAWEAVRGNVFAPAPHGVMEAYALTGYGAWAAPLAVTLACGAVWTGAMLTREIRGARARRRARRAELRVRSPRLPGEARGGERLVVLEGERPDAWLLRGGAAPRLVITTGALRRLKGPPSWMRCWPMSRGMRGPGTTGCCTARRRWPTAFRRCRSSPPSATRCTTWWSWRPTTRPRGASGG